MFDTLNNQGYGGYQNGLSGLGFGSQGSGGFDPSSILGGSNGTQGAGNSLGTFGSSLTNFGNSASGIGDLSTLQLGQLGIGGLTGLANGYLGFQNMGLAKRQAAQAQNNFNTQWNANVKSTNASLSDRQAARVASNPNAYESVDSYMKKYGIS